MMFLWICALGLGCILIGGGAGIIWANRKYHHGDDDDPYLWLVVIGAALTILSTYQLMDAQ